MGDGWSTTTDTGNQLLLPADTSTVSYQVPLVACILAIPLFLLFCGKCFHSIRISICFIILDHVAIPFHFWPQNMGFHHPSCPYNTVTYIWLEAKEEFHCLCEWHVVMTRQVEAVGGIMVTTDLIILH